MTRDDIIELALQCGIWIPIARGPERALTIHKLCRLATLVAAAERDALRAAVRHEADCVEAAKAEIKALRAKIEQMERQEPVAWTTKLALEYGSSRLGFQVSDVNMWGENGAPLYALPGAQNVPKEAIAKILTEVMNIAVANGADSRSMPDEYVEVAAWLCGVPAQNVPSVPDGLTPLEAIQYWADAYANSKGDAHFIGHGVAERLLREYADLRAMLAAAPEAKP